MEAQGSASPASSMPNLTPNFEVPGWRILENFWDDLSSESAEPANKQPEVERSLETPQPPPVLMPSIESSAGPSTLSTTAACETNSRAPAPQSTSSGPAPKRGKKSSAAPKEKQTPRRKNLTPIRKQILQKFLCDAFAQPGKYGEIGGDEWMAELIKRLRKYNGSTGNVIRPDVMSWLQLPEIESMINQIQAVASQSASQVTEHSLSSIPEVSSSSQAQVNVQITENDVIAAVIKTENDNINSMMNPAQMTTPQGQGSLGSSIPYSGSNAKGINLGNEHSTNNNNVSLSPASFSDVFAEMGSMDFGIAASTSQQQPPQQFQNQNMIPLSSELDVYTQSNGFVIRVPPSSTTTILYMKPQAFKVYKNHPNLETDAGISSTLTNTQQQPQNSGQLGQVSTPINISGGNAGVAWALEQGAEIPTSVPAQVLTNNIIYI